MHPVVPPRLEVADILRAHGSAYRHEHAGTLGTSHYRVMRAIERCRTASLGGHVERCDACHQERISYNSCRNRHCPKCQSLARAQWLEDRQAELLDCPYFHVVFTLPQEIAAMAYQNKRALYPLLFQASAETLATIAADPKHLGAEIGFLSILHTWGQNLTHHPHVHCVVPGGGLSPDGERWVACRPGFFLPVRVLSRLFRRLFLEGLRAAFEKRKLTFYSDLSPLNDRAAFDAALAPLQETEWVVYAKRPFGGPKQVLEYLGRYTHRVAISNHRLVSLNEGEVTFRWKDYRQEAAPKRMRLDAHEFIRRFLLHVLPSGLQRIRHYGWLSNRHRARKLARCRALMNIPAPVATLRLRTLDYRDRYERLTGKSLRRCPVCARGTWVCIEIFPAGAPPRTVVPPDTS
ncbi:MAG: IS91 family transposase [Acidiferrobacteraceae bacterium]